MEGRSRLVKINEILSGSRGYRWRVLKFLGEGAFGAVVLAENVDDRRKVAIKIEDTTQDVRTLKQEVDVLMALNAAQKRYCCRIFEIGRKNNIFNWMAMSLVGKGLDKLKEQMPDGRFSLPTALYLAKHTLRAIEDVHDVHFLHRDIKPANFSIGVPPDYRKIYILDFGMARSFVSQSGKYRRARQKAGFRGTPRYASSEALLMNEQGRRDDIISWLFMVTEFTVGTLPWPDSMYQDIPDIQSRIHRMAQDRNEILYNEPQQLLRGCPREYHQILRHLLTLSLPDRPDYDLIWRLLTECAVRKRLPERFRLDFEPPPVPAPYPRPLTPPYVSPDLKPPQWRATGAQARPAQAPVYPYPQLRPMAPAARPPQPPRPQAHGYPPQPHRIPAPAPYPPQQNRQQPARRAPPRIPYPLPAALRYPPQPPMAPRQRAPLMGRPPRQQYQPRQRHGYPDQYNNGYQRQ